MNYFVFDFDSNEVMFISKDINKICDWIYKNQEEVIDKNVHVVDENLNFVDIY